MFMSRITARMQNWWLVALRGVIAIIFGILAIAIPGETVRVLLILFAIFAIVDGVISIVDAFTVGSAIGHTGLFLLTGLFSLFIGIVTLLAPLAILLTVIFLIAVRAVVLGISEIVLAVRQRHQINYGWLLGFSGGISILFGVIIGLAPLHSLAFFALFIGMYAIFVGVAQLALAWDIHTEKAS